MQQWSPGEASPSGLAVIEGTVFIANLRGQVLRAVPVADPSAATDLLRGGVRASAGCDPGARRPLWILTNNTDGRGDPVEGDDRILSVECHDEWSSGGPDEPSTTLAYAILAVIVVILAAVAWRVLPLFTGPAVPAGATRLHIVTERPNLVMGCATALLAPATVATDGDDLILDHRRVG